MTPLDVLRIALENEKKAYDFYDEMLKKYNSPVIEEILIALKDAEYKHRKIIEDKIAQINKAA